MTCRLSPDISIRELQLGREKAPLLVIDDFVADPVSLAGLAQGREFRPVPRAFPGIRAEAPREYQRLLAEELGPRLIDFFGLDAEFLQPSLCHYSLVTLFADELAPLQRIPHVDSLQPDGLATIHYLFEANFGGTAFYRHRATGFETIDKSREAEYVAVLKAEFAGPDSPRAEYISGDTPLFECIEAQPAAFNRMLVYRRNSLHSGNLDPNFVPNPDPATGRLSINSFLDTA